MARVQMFNLDPRYLAQTFLPVWILVYAGHAFDPDHSSDLDCYFALGFSFHLDAPFDPHLAFDLGAQPTFVCSPPPLIFACLASGVESE